MKEKFKTRLKEFLESEANGDGISHLIDETEFLNWDEYTKIPVIISRFEKSITIYFGYNSDEKTLEIQSDDCCCYAVREYDWTVKYFWILAAPALFGN